MQELSSSRNSIYALLSRLQAKGVRLWTEGETLRFQTSSEGGLDEADREALVARRPEVLDFLRRASALPVARQAVQPRRQRSGPQPLSFEQERLWFLDKVLPGSSAYLITGAFRLQGKLATAALEQALSQIVRRHEALRTWIDGEGDQPSAWIVGQAHLPLHTVDLSALAPTLLNDAFAKLLRAETARPIDLRCPPVMRATLVQMGTNDARLLITVHHILFDEWSLGIVAKELALFYNDFVAGKQNSVAPPELHASDFAAAQRLPAARESVQQGLAYWTQKLNTVPQFLNLPTDGTRSPVRDARAAVAEAHLPSELVTRLRTLACAEGTTLPVMFFAGVAALLMRYAAQDDFALGTPVVNREAAGAEATVGLLTNMVALRCDLSGDLTLREVVRRMARVCREAQTYSYVPFQDVLGKLPIERNLSHNPLFQVVVALKETGQPVQLGSVRLEPLPVPPGTAKFDLVWFFDEHGAISVEYDDALFAGTTARSMAARLVFLLEAFVHQADQPLLATSLEPPKPIFPVSGQPTAEEVFLDRFAAVASVKAEATAVACVDADGEPHALSYRSLALQSDRLAAKFISRGVQPDLPIAVCIEATEARPILLLAILKAGAAYVALDVRWPDERWKSVLADAQPQLVITHQKLARHPALDHQAVLTWEEIAVASQHAPGKETPSLRTVAPRSLAYMLYTSGSTGVPKGIAIEHRNISAFLNWATSFFSAEELTTVLAATPLCFDISTFELFAPLCAGGTVVLRDNVMDLTPVVRAFPITLLNTVPSIADELVRCNALPPEAQTVNLAGEPLARETVDRVFRNSNATRAVNLYGPSETTTYSTAAVLDRASSGRPPLGEPITGTYLYLLDAGLQPVPNGITGEVCIAGAGVSRGYVGRSDLTAERYLPDPFFPAPGARMYRSGDQARRRADGSLEYLGRFDHQIKLRGHRIELGELEAQLRMLPDVRTAAATVRQAFSGPSLIAYLVLENAKALTVAEVRHHLAARLPEYMLPTEIVFLDEMPFTATGKIDRRALPPPPPEPPPTAAAPQAFTPEETLLIELWEELLGKRPDNLDLSFFEMGGHSLHLLKLSHRLSAALGRPVSVVELFQFPTPRTLATHLQQGAAPRNDEAITAESRGHRRAAAYAGGLRHRDREDLSRV